MKFPSEAVDWQPTASLSNLKARAKLLAQLRTFFSTRDVMEVSTPLLASAGVTDPFLENFTAQFNHGVDGREQTLYLQTSPEYAMKRLLAAGCEHIYQIGPAFRHEGAGRFHNPEFTMLEWYRTGFTMQALVDEVGELLIHILNVDRVSQISYQQVFLNSLDIDPLTASLTQLLDVARSRGLDFHSETGGWDKDDVLQWLFATCIEPRFANTTPVIVSHFPASQAALATINDDDPRTANRFEAYYKGIELANGFDELTDAEEQRRRFDADNQKRARLKLPQMPLDERFLHALEAGLPSCAGVALGIDRLLMLKLGARDIKDVIAFPTGQ